MGAAALANIPLAHGQELRGGSNAPLFPLTTTEQLKAYLAEDDAPIYLVAFEMSGALLSKLLAQGKKAMSVDVVQPEHDLPSFRGDVRVAVEAKYWEAIFFVGPNCYQHLLGDVYCVRHKILDCRAYWAGAMVIGASALAMRGWC